MLAQERIRKGRKKERKKENKESMEFKQEEESVEEPVSPTGQYFNSSVLSVCVLAVLESDVPIDDSPTMTLLEDVFLPINPRFSSIMVSDKNGGKQWKKIEVKLKNHVNVPIAMEPLPQSQPLWEIHILKYPTSNAAGHLIFKLHNALGDGFSLIGALLSCLQRSSLVEDVRSSICSGDDGVEFKPITVSAMTFSLDRIKQIKAKLGVTINDVITGIIFYGIRLYMLAVSNKLKNTHSTTLVVLNTRMIDGYNSVTEMVKPNAESPWGNQFGFLHVSMPELTKNAVLNPLEFFHKAHKIINKKRNSFAVALTGRLLETLRKLRGPETTIKYILSTLKNSSMTISNVIGPVEKKGLANHPVNGLYFMVVGVPQVLLFLFPIDLATIKTDIQKVL